MLPPADQKGQNMKRYCITFDWDVDSYYIFDLIDQKTIDIAPPLKNHPDHFNMEKYRELIEKSIQLNNANDELIAFTKEIINYVT